MYVKMSTYSFIQLLTSSSYVFLGYHFPVPHKGILFLVLLAEKSLYLSLAVSYLYCSYLSNKWTWPLILFKEQIPSYPFIRDTIIVMHNIHIWAGTYFQFQNVESLWNKAVKKSKKSRNIINCLIGPTIKFCFIKRINMTLLERLWQVVGPRN